MASLKVYSYRLSYDVGTGGYYSLRVYTGPGQISDWSEWFPVNPAEFCAVSAALKMPDVTYNVEKKQFTSSESQPGAIV